MAYMAKTATAKTKAKYRGFFPFGFAQGQNDKDFGAEFLVTLA